MDGRRLHILIIDDTPEDRENYRRLLSGDGRKKYFFTETGSAEEGIELCQRGGFHCVLLDFMLHDGTGLDVLRVIHNEAQPPTVAVVMLTGQGDEEIAVQAMKSGAQDYLGKGNITADSLQRAVHHAVDRVAFLHRIEEQRAELERLATLDGLTGLYNRRHFLERTEEELHRAKRYEQPLSLLLLDLDHFKAVNDRHGHVLGDRVLASVGTVLKSLRRTDIAGRYGGEEFCILSTNTDLAGAATLAESVRQSIESQVAAATDKALSPITCSIGVAQCGPETRAVQDLLRAADGALYRAKAAGRNCVMLAPAHEAAELHVSLT